MLALYWLCIQGLPAGGALLHATVSLEVTLQQWQRVVSMGGCSDGDVHAVQVEDMAQACWPGDPRGEAGIMQISFAVRGEDQELPPPVAATPAEQPPSQQPRPERLLQEVAIGA